MGDDREATKDDHETMEDEGETWVSLLVASTSLLVVGVVVPAQTPAS